MPRNLQILAGLHEININENPFEDIPGVVDSLKTVGPGLKSLHINLFEEDHAKYLLSNLEDLQVLNGLKVDRATLFERAQSEEDEDHREPKQEPEVKPRKRRPPRKTQRIIPGPKEEEIKEGEWFPMKIHKINIEHLMGEEVNIDKLMESSDEERMIELIPDSPRRKYFEKLNKKSA